MHNKRDIQSKTFVFSLARLPYPIIINSSMLSFSVNVPNYLLIVETDGTNTNKQSKSNVLLFSKIDIGRLKPLTLIYSFIILFNLFFDFFVMQSIKLVYRLLQIEILLQNRR